MVTGFKSILLLVITTLFSLTNTNGQNLQTNGGFESGISENDYLVNSYTFLNTTKGTSTSGNHAITTNPSVMNASFMLGDAIFMNLNWVTLPFLRFTNLLKKIK